MEGEEEKERGKGKETWSHAVQLLLLLARQTHHSAWVAVVLHASSMYYYLDKLSFTFRSTQMN